MRYARFFAFLLTLGLFACAGARSEIQHGGAAKQPSAPQFDRLKAAVRAQVEAGRLPGVVMVVMQNDQIVLDEAIGTRDPATHAPMQRDAIFRLASMTKPIVSATAMTLVEDGTILLSDPVSKYIPELAGLKVGVEKAGRDGQPVLELVATEHEMTIHDLLRHTSGLTAAFLGPSLVRAEYTKHGVDAPGLTSDEFIKRLSQVPLQFQPAKSWEYGQSTNVLGVVIERASSKPLDEFVAERILRPLKMLDTGFWVEPGKQARIAQSFAVDPETKKPIDVRDVRARPSFLSGAGGMVSTAHDYLRFARALRNGGELDGVRILSRHTVRLMTSDHTSGLRGPGFFPGPGYGFGLGFAVRVEPGEAPLPGNVGDFSWYGSSGTNFWVDPAEDLIAIWLSQAPGGYEDYRRLFRNLVYGSLTP
jgi:CubicO group peptidase (beta-lactamase class C family)